MKQKKIPMRTCVITHEKYPKKELIRVVRTPEGNVVVDTTGKQNGNEPREEKMCLNSEAALKGVVLLDNLGA